LAGRSAPVDKSGDPQSQTCLGVSAPAGSPDPAEKQRPWQSPASRCRLL